MDQDFSSVDHEDQNSRWTKYLPKDDTPMTPEGRKMVHRLECCDDEICTKYTTHRDWPEIIRDIKAAQQKEEVKVEKRILPHLNPILTHARKRSEAEMLGGDEDKRINEPSVENKDSKEIQDELTDEEIFYSTYIQKSDDMWEALDEEVKEIEKFFLSKNTK